MELPGSSYLYTLATISITFAGFATLSAIFRQMVGGTRSDFDIFFVRTVLVRGFMVAGCAMLPPLLALFELSHTTVWRLSSLIAAVILGLFLLTWLANRSIVTNIPMTKWSIANYICQSLSAVFMLLIATGLFFEASAGTFAAGLTVFMLLGFVGYMLALKILLQEEPKAKRRSARTPMHG